MAYISCADAAKAMGITIRRIQQMCKRGEIPGAAKEVRTWMIPAQALHKGRNVVEIQGFAGTLDWVEIKIV